ncbi:hypothetical protein AB1Y20_002372 [Prymnesium parvum]|uniref:Glutamine amidotransferase type-2 domain-containing protein n=1 Tax=Prymnesium parvum TaxID=97485 RepID=A0AB34J955_PRYPA
MLTPSAVLAFATARLATVLLHELAHAMAALSLGWTVRLHSVASFAAYLRGSSAGSLHVSGITAEDSNAVRHIGWIFSVGLVLAFLNLPHVSASVVLATSWTALDAVTSDLLGQGEGGTGAFFCGNFGLLILTSVKRSRAYHLIREMLRVTMVRGAQSAGIVTYKGQGGAVCGVRTRVVNGKRTDLSDLLVGKLKAKDGLLTRFTQQLLDGGTLFQGHTRFATSSISNLEGCHPHQWVPRTQQTTWRFGGAEGFVSLKANLESFVTHNGDLDIFEIHGASYSLEEVQVMLTHFLGIPPPSEVDSAVIAGLLDLLRTKGVWSASVRYGYLYGGLAKTRSRVSMILPQLATLHELQKIAVLFEAEWKKVVQETRGLLQDDSTAATEPFLARRLSQMMEERMVPLIANKGERVEVRMPLGVGSEATRDFVVESIRAFFFNDLLEAAQALLRGAQGTFGLVLSHSLDAEQELVIAARGQTMSVAFYPSSGIVSFGSEASATKVPMQAGEADSFRFDLDDVVGEVLLLRWDKSSLPTQGSGRMQSSGRAHVIDGANPRIGTEVFQLKDSTVLLAANFLEDKAHRPFWDRRLRLGGNPLISPPLSSVCADPVGRDLLDIAGVMRRMEEDWAKGPEALNRITAWNLVSKLREKLLMRSSRERERTRNLDGAVDLLLIGCEVSLWLAEQFAADMHLVFPKLKVVAISSNKLLGQLGQQYPMPQLGFSFNQNTYSLHDSIVVALSNTGGTFGTLACLNLLRGCTSDIFVITSERDSQVARAVGGLDSNFVFSTFAGFRAAEPCSLAVVVIHHLLSHLLIFIMSYIAHFDREACLGGSFYATEEVKELEALKRKQVESVEEIVGRAKLGDTSTSSQLRAQGKVWAEHVLESPISWLMSLAYIAGTLIARKTPAGAIADAALGHPLAAPTSGDATAAEIALSYVITVFDVMVYAFLPWWTTVLLRLVQRRPWLHRVAGRSVLIGDIPWVAQSVEAFASKCFALSYSIASASFFSANPNDHLVHRHTHRIVRGSLLAVGRPDGRLNSLTTAEAACCLSVKQASSIQNLGVTCESITIGHNPFKLPLAAAAITLPTNRLPFVSEILSEDHPKDEEDDLFSNTPIAETSPHHMRSGSPNRSRSGYLQHSVMMDAIAHGGTRSGSPIRTRSGSPIRSRSGYLQHSVMMDAIAHGGSVRRGNGYVDVHVNQPSLSTTRQHYLSPPGLGHGSSRRLLPSRENSAIEGARRHSSSDCLGARRHSSSDCLGARRHSSSDCLGVRRHSSSGCLTIRASREPLDEKSCTSSCHRGGAECPGSAASTCTDTLTSFVTSPLTRETSTQDKRFSSSSGSVSIQFDTLIRKLMELKRNEANFQTKSMKPAFQSTSPSRVSQSSSPLSSSSCTPTRVRRSAPCAQKYSSLAGIRASLDRLQTDSTAADKLGAIAKRHSTDQGMSKLKLIKKVLELQTIEPLSEPFYGAWMLEANAANSVASLMERQELLQQLNETRFDSMQRMVAFMVLFHKMAKDVQEFMSFASLGFLNYDMSKTQSMLRVATTASPVSGTEVRAKMLEIKQDTLQNRAAAALQRRWRSRERMFAKEASIVLRARNALTQALGGPETAISCSST